LRVLRELKLTLATSGPDPDGLGLLDPDPSINKQKMKKNLDFNCSVTSYHFLSLKNDVNIPLNRNKHKNLEILIC
jgi:hypothetical protein